MLDGVAAGGRSLLLRAFAGGCLTPPVTARVTETATTITPVVRVTSHDETACTDELRFIPVTAQLTAPVGGRTIVGLHDQSGTPGYTVIPGASETPPKTEVATTATGAVVTTVVDPAPVTNVVLLRVPDVVGLSPADATIVVHGAGLHVRLSGRGRQVIAQSPADGTLWNEPHQLHDHVVLRLGN